MDMDRPKPFGMWERWHIANDTRWTDRYQPSSFAVMLANKQIPNVEPSLKMYGRYLYDESAVDEFFRALSAQHADAPARAAARKAEEAERQRAEQIRFDGEMARMRREQEVLKSGLEVQAQLEADEAARRERALRGDW